MRRSRESSAKGHTTPPLMVEVVDPIADHPVLGPMRDRRMKRAARKGKKTAVKVEVKVEDGKADADEG